MAVRAISNSIRVGSAHEVLAGGATYALYNRTGKPQHCVRKILILANGTLSSLKDSGENNVAPGTVTAGMVFEGNYSEVTCTSAVYVTW
jgi:hypothetical protein